MPNTPTTTVYPPASEVMPQTTKLLKSSPRTAHGYTPFVTTRINIAPASLATALVLFLLPAALFTLAIHLVGPVMRLHGSTWWVTYHVILVLPMALLLAAALVALRLETHSLSWPRVRDRFRLRRLNRSGWLWSMALAGFMYGGNVGDGIALVGSGLALWIESRKNAFLWPLIAGFTWAKRNLGALQPLLEKIRFYEQSEFVKEFLSRFGPGDFMGIPLAGAWWLVFYYAAILLIFNVGGEELWWRGYVLPRQELACGKWAWIVHGALWAVFHIFFQPTLWDMVRMCPTCLALAFVCQRLQNTWPGVIGHTFGNMPFLLQLVRGAAN